MPLAGGSAIVRAQWRPTLIKAVALDAMGVIYTVADDLRSLLIPFLRESGCTLTDEEIAVVCRSCYRDGETAADCWAAMACGGDVDELEDRFLSMYELTPGVIQFLQKMKAEAIPVYMLSNDVKEWSLKRRVTHQLDAYFAGFVVSGQIRAYKPNPEIYNELLNMLECDASECLFVDDILANLRAGVHAGLIPVQFSPEPSDEFQSVRDFEQLANLVLTARQRRNYE